MSVSPSVSASVTPGPLSFISHVTAVDSSQGVVLCQPADVNADGHADFVLVSNTPASISVAFGSTWISPTVRALELDQPAALAVADMNAGGLIDVVLANGSAVLLSTNTGRGDFITAPSVRVSDQGASTMLLRDRDADGTTDVVLLSVGKLSLSVCCWYRCVHWQDWL